MTTVDSSSKVAKKEENRDHDPNAKDIVVIPEHLQGDTFNPDDVQIDSEDLGLSRIKLAQKFKEDVCKPGEYIDEKTGDNYGKQLEFIILRQEKEWVKFTKSEPYELIARSKTKGVWDYVVGKDGETWPMGEETLKDKDGNSYTASEERTCLQFTYTILVANQSTNIPSVLSFKGAPSIKGAGRPLVGLISRFIEKDNLPIYAHTYKINSAPGMNETFYSLASNGGFTSKEDYDRAKVSYTQLNSSSEPKQTQKVIDESVD